MSLLGNLIWIICGGFLISLGYIIGGLIICCTIVGMPVGWAYIKLGVASFAPFGKVIVTEKNAEDPLYWVMNILWFVFIGWSMLLSHLFWAAVFGITVIGIPFARQHLKLIPVSAFPYGRSLKDPTK